jgi:spermidine/putrescine transport system permease protein
VRRFLRVVLPISRPGVVAAFFMVFIPTVGEYVTPLLIGGSSGSMYGNIVQDFFTKAANWPLGSALAMVMLAGTLVAVVLAALLIDVRRLVEQ